ncbi:MAG: hypothetical protein Q6370_024200 [Candidatus Sigynarchaeota archaeon]
MSLSSQQVSPAYGSSGTPFNFSVVYTDTANMLPGSITININGSTRAMVMPTRPTRLPDFKQWVSSPACAQPLAYIKDYPFCPAPISLNRKTYTLYNGKLVQCANCKKNVMI